MQLSLIHMGMYLGCTSITLKLLHKDLGNKTKQKTTLLQHCDKLIYREQTNSLSTPVPLA